MVVNYQHFFEMSNELLCIADKQGRFIKLNKTWETVLGYQTAELEGKPYIDFVHPDDVESTLNATNNLSSNQSLDNFTNRYRTKDGNYRYIEWRSQPCGDLVYASSRDVTDKVLHDQLLQNAAMQALEKNYNFQLLIDTVPDVIFVKNKAGKFLLANKAMAKLYGTDVEQLLGNTDSDYSPTVAERAGFIDVDRAVIEKGEDISMEEKVTDYLGIIHWFQTIKVPIKYDGEVCVLGVARNVSEQKLIDEALKMNVQRFEDVAKAAGEYIWELDENGIYQFVSDRITKILKRPMSEIVGHGPFEFMFPEDALDVELAFADIAADQKSFSGLEHRSVCGDGSIIWQQVSGLPMYGSDGELVGYRGTGADITDRKLLEEELHTMANYDKLTGLPNRRLFFELLKSALETSKRNTQLLALMFVDLDGFKSINDTFGHDTGDDLLVAVAESLAATIRSADTVARLGGDEFVIILQNPDTKTSITHIAAKILDKMHTPFILNGNECKIGASIGIGIFPNDGDSVETLLANADKAMYDVKHNSKGNYKFYEDL